MKDKLKEIDEWITITQTGKFGGLRLSVRAVKYFRWLIFKVNEYRADLQKIKVEIKRLRGIILVNNLWQEAPCCLCGYTGEGYFDSKRHTCILEAAEVLEIKEREGK